MKKSKKKHLALLLSAAMVFSSLSVSTVAAEEQNSGITYPGELVTTKVGSLSDDRSQSFNEGWKFYLGTSSLAQNPNFNDSDWESVTLPHDFSITQEFTTSGEAESGFLPGGTGWYRKTFVAPESFDGKRIVINFDGVYSNATVYVNGTQVGEHHYGYTSFAFDITDYLTCDGQTENVIAVKAVNNIPSSRWYSGSGIYRDVTLLVTDSVHVGYNGTYVTTPNIADGNGTVNVQTEIDNESTDDVQVTLRNTVYTKSGEKASDSVETEVSVKSGASATATNAPVVANPKLWSVEDPNLYYVRTELEVDGTVVDTYDTTFGFRYVSFDSNTGFYLNGKAVKLNGVCMHHDQGALGSAAYYDAMYRQLSTMKDMGVNAIRTSHNPADEDFIEICNELGLLVIEEAFDGWELPKNSNSNDFSAYFNSSLGSANVIGGESDMTWAEFAVKSVVKRDRNQPSVILWSLGNEVDEGVSGSSNLAAVASNLIDWIQEVDTAHQTTIGSNRRSTSSPYGTLYTTIINKGGIVGFNYASESELSSLHSTYGPIIASETSSAVNSRGIYMSQASNSNVDGKYHLTSYDTSKVSWGSTAHDSMYITLRNDYVSGEFVWTGFDYIGEPTPWNGVSSGSVSGVGATPNSSYFGIVETTGFPKDTYYLYRSQWNQDETTLHLVTAWDSDNMLTSSGKTPVVVYSNAAKVELYRNGTLIGTVVRTVNKTAAGHEYYTYTTSSEDSNICTAVAGSGSGSLYATFNVAYEAGTISAKAYDENDQLIEDTSGNASVSTPGTVSKLKVAANKNSILADGSSLCYISVDVQDSDGILDTTATNAIKFSLEGNGEIAGVDNGDQATTDKYQQSSVLNSTTSANINAYAGKALVIVRSTKDAGEFTVNVTSDGLAGSSVTVTTTPSGKGNGEGISSYTMVRDYTVKVGTVPALQTAASGTLADGTNVTGTVAWDEIPETVYNTVGDYTIKGVLKLENQEDLNVTCKLHVIEDVIAVRNVSTATAINTVPTLPSTVAGILNDGTISGEFAVTWDDMTAGDFANAGSIVVVKGTAKIIGDITCPVTASVRVTELTSLESTNVAPVASGLTQDIAEGKQSDNLNSINNGITKPGDNTQERWSNWNNRTTSDKATLTFSWDTAQVLSSVNLYYYIDGCADLPSKVEFQYSLNGNEFVSVDAESALVEEYSLGAEYSYTFSKIISPVALRIIFTQQNGTSGSDCVALTEAEIMTYAGQIEYNGSALLSGISVDGTAISDFVEGQYTYTAAGSTVEATTNRNAGITILPEYAGIIRILTISENGKETHTYEITVSGEKGCTHENTEIQNAVDATCTETGYSGDKVCTSCGEIVETGSTIAAKGHSYGPGVVTKGPTETEEGVRTYTCTVCGATKTEAIPKLVVSLKAPVPTLSVAATTDGKIAMTGKFEDYENISKYYKVTSHGLVYAQLSKIGTRVLTVNTSGRIRVNFTSYKEDGSYTYNMKPTSSTTKYVVRSFLSYEDDKGRTIYVYSDAVTVSYSSLSQ